jgi:hypothetical protein
VESKKKLPVLEITASDWDGTTRVFEASYEDALVIGEVIQKKGLNK